jgi:hypothetical protein
MSFYVSITTIKKYKVALDMLLASLPEEWKNKYIVVYQDEPENGITVFEDGHIEVRITNNLSDYGNWVGAQILIDTNVVPRDTWFLFIHDTCKFVSNECVQSVTNIINAHNELEVDILWLCANGQCNICLIRREGITWGNNVYKNITYMTKPETVNYEWIHDHPLSPKSFPVPQQFINIPTIYLGSMYVYNDVNLREVLLYSIINMEKYYYYVTNTNTHPMAP